IGANAKLSQDQHLGATVPYTMFSPQYNDYLYILSVGKLKTGRMSITLCGYNPPWEDLSAAQKNSLTHRYQSGCDCKVCVCAGNYSNYYIPVYTSDTCLWTDLGTDNGQNLACIKRQDGSCAWYKGIALPKK
uniref:Tissue inhibitor of metalloproteinases 2 n=1 Tax=Oncorhynchus mykiss TaxID=8022 RepID=A0A8K9X0F0_ONCMY